MKTADKIINHFITGLKKHFPTGVKLQYNYPVLEIKAQKDALNICFFKESPILSPQKVKLNIGLHQLVLKEKQLLCTIQSQLQLNKKIFARNCTIKKIDTPEARVFLNCYHLMGFATSAYHLGLFLKEELVGVASFSKGRKMNRLEANQRSFELVRFCSKEGITITGGLSKILKHFVSDKKPGDIMTYIDKQFSEGKSYFTCGFKLHSETTKQHFLVNKLTFEFTNYKGGEFDNHLFYLTENCGNLKLVYTP